MAARRGSRSCPPYWRRDGDRWLVRSFGGVVPGGSGAARLPRLVVRGRRVRALGRQAPADRGRVGEGGRGDAPPATTARTWTSSRSAARRPAPMPTGDSAYGVRQLLGDVWEWTASGFDAYPGFRAFPYPEYSQDFFGGPFKVLRGGSWATQAGAVTTTFRNWDYPQRRQIFAGFRCAAAWRTDDGHRDRESGSGADRRPPARRHARVAGGRRAQGPVALSPRAASQVLLRRARLGAVRADHRAARVLPVAGRAGHPRRRRRRASSSSCAPAEIVELGPGSARKTTALLGPMLGPRPRLPLHPGGRLRDRGAGLRGAAGQHLRLPGRARRRGRLRAPPRPHPARDRAAPDRVPRRHDRQPRPSAAQPAC